MIGYSRKRFDICFWARFECFLAKIVFRTRTLGIRLCPTWFLDLLDATYSIFPNLWSQLCNGLFILHKKLRLTCYRLHLYQNVKNRNIDFDGDCWNSVLLYYSKKPYLETFTVVWLFWNIAPAILKHACYNTLSCNCFYARIPDSFLP